MAQKEAVPGSLCPKRAAQLHSQLDKAMPAHTQTKDSHSTSGTAGYVQASLSSLRKELSGLPYTWLMRGLKKVSVQTSVEMAKIIQTELLIILSIN